MVFSTCARISKCTEFTSLSSTSTICGCVWEKKGQNQEMILKGIKVISFTRHDESTIFSYSLRTFRWKSIFSYSSLPYSFLSAAFSKDILRSKTKSGFGRPFSMFQHHSLFNSWNFILKTRLYSWKEFFKKSTNDNILTFAAEKATPENEYLSATMVVPWASDLRIHWLKNMIQIRINADLQWSIDKNLWENHYSNSRRLSANSWCNFDLSNCAFLVVRISLIFCPIGVDRSTSFKMYTFIRHN